MSREILFKGKRRDNGEWVEGNVLKLKCDNSDDEYMYYIIPEVTNGSWCKNNYALKFISPCFEVNPETICQYTGLTDKNGNKIWENDVVEIPRENSLFKIEWQEDTAKWIMSNEVDGFIVDFDNYWGYEVEVVGNVFDNPELLNR